MKNSVIWVGVLCAALAVTTAWGDTPPSWRGTPGTTYEAWNFVASNSPVAPESFTNGYGTPSAVIDYNPPTGTGWYDTLTNVYGPVQGFWDIARGSVTLTVPVATNSQSSVIKEMIQVQVTYYRDITRAPSLSIPNGTQIGSTVTTPGVDGLNGTWYTDLSTWRIQPSANPNTVTITGNTRGSIIDQIIVDTQMTNYPPVATTMTVTRTAGLSLKIFWSDLTNHWSSPNGNAVALAGFNLTSTNNVAVSTNGQLILYPKTAANLNDQLSYTITDGQGGTNVGYINIVVNGSLTGPVQVVGGNPTTLTGYGLPGFSYIAERSTNLVNWVDIATNTAAANGVITVTDYFSDLGSNAPPSAFYQLKWSGY
jgi:hypothetical protein